MNLAYNYWRDYDLSLGRYVQADPIGLRGGKNLFTYVADNPLIAYDTFGLAKWKGTMNSFGVTVYGQDEFDLESECKCGYKLAIHVTVKYGSFGPGFTRTVSDVDFEDNFACPNGMAFDGLAFRVSAGFAVRYGKGFNFIVLGRATSPGQWDSEEGIDASAGVSVGGSTVGPITRSECPCNQK